MTRPEISTGEALVSLLEAYGVEQIFGIPGVHNVEMYRALPRSNIKHILTRHEQGAGFMADGYARATGKPGVCFTISGPGVTNILTPLGQAWSDSSPVLVISTALDISDSVQGRGRLHEMLDQRGAAAAVTSLALRCYTQKDIQDAVARAFANFASTRPRPAYIEIPLDVLNQAAGDGWHKRALPQRPLAHDAEVAAAVSKIQNSKSPIMILGGGALQSGFAAILIAEKLGCPILTTTAGKGTVPADHPLCWGYLLGNAETQNILLKSDCIIAAGTELSETDFWSDFVIRKNLIRIDVDANTLARPHTADVAILGDASDTLQRINAKLSINLTAAFTKPKTDQSDLRLQLAKVLVVIRENLPRNCVVISDMTQIAYAANEIFEIYEPRTWLHPVGFGTLGFALPAGIGAKFGVNEKPVVVLIGDYGLQYTINELGTAVEHNLPLPILLWNNDALGQIRDDMVNKGIQPNAVTLRNPDFQAVANAYGAAAVKPNTLSELALSIQKALCADGPTLIEMTPRLLN